MELHNLEYTTGARGQKVKRVGRGHGSGIGKTSTRGSNGQKSRKSGHTRLGFEGGQTPLYRRVPKVGFNNVNFANDYAVVSLEMINAKQLTGKLDFDALKKAGLISGNKKIQLKIIGNAQVKNGTTIAANKFSSGAIKALEASGAKYEIIK